MGIWCTWRWVVWRRNKSCYIGVVSQQKNPSLALGGVYRWTFFFRQTLNNFFRVFLFLLFILIRFSGSAIRHREKSVRYRFRAASVRERPSALLPYESERHRGDKENRRPFLKAETCERKLNAFLLSAAKVIVTFFSPTGVFVWKLLYFACLEFYVSKAFCFLPRLSTRICLLHSISHGVMYSSDSWILIMTGLGLGRFYHGDGSRGKRIWRA